MDNEQSLQLAATILGPLLAAEGRSAASHVGTAVMLFDLAEAIKAEATNRNNQRTQEKLDTFAALGR